MKYYTLISLLLITSGFTKKNNIIDTSAERTFEVRQISNGNNKPKIDITDDNMDIFLVALHNNISVKNIADKLNWSDEKLQKNIELLTKNKLLKKEGDKYIPALGIFTSDRGIILKERCASLSQEIADSIKKQLDKIKILHNCTDISKTYSFNDLSFFYLSDVLLDNGQINNVEAKFLNKKRPLRNGSRYYLAILENEKNSIEEPFGIYGNKILVRNNSNIISVYGNTRTELNKGWQDYKSKIIHSFSKADFKILNYDMPNVFMTTLLQILEKHKADFEDQYVELRFDKEISFEEFFIWWYHIIYTKATNDLIDENIIQKPNNGLFYYGINNIVT